MITIKQIEEQVWNLKNKNTYVFTIYFTDEDTGGVEDITDWTIKFTAKSDVDDLDDDAVIKKDITSHTDPAAGETQITLTSTDTDLLGSYVFDIQAETDDGEVKTITEGILNFSKRITTR